MYSVDARTNYYYTNCTQLFYGSSAAEVFTWPEDQVVMSLHEGGAAAAHTGLLDEMMNFASVEMAEWTGEDCIDWAGSVCKQYGIERNIVNIWSFRNYSGSQLVNFSHSEMCDIVGTVYGLTFYTELQKMKNKQCAARREHSSLQGTPSTADSTLSTTTSTESVHSSSTNTGGLPWWTMPQDSPLPAGSPWSQLLQEDFLQDSPIAPLAQDFGALNIDGGFGGIAGYGGEDNGIGVAVGGPGGAVGGFGATAGGFGDISSRFPGADDGTGDAASGFGGAAGGLGGAVGESPEAHDIVAQWAWALDPIQVERGRTRGPIVWEFLVRLLIHPSSNPSLVLWENEAEGTFRLAQPGLIARIWGGRSANPNLSYNNFARALRHHYEKGNLVANPDRQLVYGLGTRALRYLQQLRSRQQHR